MNKQEEDIDGIQFLKTFSKNLGLEKMIANSTEYYLILSENITNAEIGNPGFHSNPNFTRLEDTTTPFNCENGTNQISNNKNSSDEGLFDFYRVEQLTFLGSLFFLIVIGNCAVLGALLLSKSPRKSRVNFFIMHLALADLGVGLINVLSDFIWKITITWYAGNFGCKVVQYFRTVVLYSSNYVLVALSIDRYDAITHPLQFSSSWRRARILIGVAWCLSLVFALPAIIIFHIENLSHGGVLIPQCWAKLSQHQWQIYVPIVFIKLFIIPAVIIAACYTIMVKTIWTQSRILTPTQILPGKSSNGSNSVTNGLVRKSVSRKKENLRGLGPGGCDDDLRRASSRGLIPKAKIKSVKMTFVIVFVFILCSCPYFVFSLLQSYKMIPETASSKKIATFFQSLSPLNSAANPIIYCLFSNNICRNLRKIKFINWISLKFCPGFGKSKSSTNRRCGTATSSNFHKSGATSRSKTKSLTITTSFTDYSLKVHQCVKPMNKYSAGSNSRPPLSNPSIIKSDKARYEETYKDSSKTIVENQF